MKINDIVGLVKNPYSIARFLNHRGLLNWMSDERFVKVMYRAYIGKRLDLKHPKTYNEKLQWIKLYDRKPEYSRNADKYLVRKHIEKTIGAEYLIPLIGVYRNTDEIPWNDLPNKFVLKCNHGSHTNIICKDKGQLDISLVTQKLNEWMKKNWFYHGREWCYKDIKPLIICEEYLETSNNAPPIDYKFMCFNGTPKLIQVHENRGNDNYSLSYYSPTWEKTSIKRIDAPTTSAYTQKPEKLDEMLGIATSLAKGTLFCRVDLYYENNKIYFGEITYYPTGGLSTFDDDETDAYLGSLIQLPTDLISKHKN